MATKSNSCIFATWKRYLIWGCGIIFHLGNLIFPPEKVLRCGRGEYIHNHIHE